MIKIYTVASCSSCKKAKEWLREHDLEYEEVNLITDQLTNEEMLRILSLTEEGTEEIISRRSKAYAKLNIDFDELSISALLEIIEKNRTLLRRPLIIDDKRLQVGYNEDDIRKFLPRSVREIECQTAGSNIKEEMLSQGII
ncbi:ArsR family transcriptional regulator [Lactococcus hodotermopsidis]|uniref:ArsR family transcriptional regulator n=1 Tax=Pseudolactococcus hodotermopsidis TaxID=2709157 RepID=A0A6A0B8R3_9LACT|nr:transcriptional regulator Spx [Lactococcus hodotermopsidis]GFH41722.1 ArsR family transcriptional regulator [Lactococcus hodotermopsidis]